MEIIGIGVDIQDVERIKQTFFEKGKRGLERIFTNDEIAELEERVDPELHIAGKFAAKEAVFKSLSLERGEGFFINEIEIIGRFGKPPRCRFLGSLEQRRSRGRIFNIMLSISHTEDNAVAFALHYR